MRLTVHELARRIDLSAVRTDVDRTEVRQLADLARRYRCVCTFVMPCYVDELKQLLADAPDVGVGAVVGFPSGAVSTATKVIEVHEQLALGVTEVDMVMNVGMLRSGDDAFVEDDIRVVVAAAQGVPVKVILEAHYLTDEQIVRASRLCVRAGAAFVKTGTGWAPTGATLHNVAVIRSAIGQSARIKAAGGVRDLPTVIEMLRLGVDRFGIGLAAGKKILGECAALPDGTLDVHEGSGVQNSILAGEDPPCGDGNNGQD
jgi:deoxyribose-phosphate aldolase